LSKGKKKGAWEVAKVRGRRRRRRRNGVCVDGVCVTKASQSQSIG
jgi:hypothetical protein